MVKDCDAKQTQRQLLIDAIMSFQSSDECEHFLKGLLSPHEFDIVAKRFNVAANLACGKGYNEVAKYVHVSSATVGKVKRMLYYGRDSEHFEEFILRFLKEREGLDTL